MGWIVGRGTSEQDGATDSGRRSRKDHRGGDDNDDAHQDAYKQTSAAAFTPSPTHGNQWRAGYLAERMRELARAWARTQMPEP